MSEQQASKRLTFRLPRVRSLMVKLTLAFLCVGLLGALLVAFFVGQRTQEAFGQFVDDRDRAALVTTLAQYYEANGTWVGADRVISVARRGIATSGRRPPPITLAAPDGRVIVGDGRYHDEIQLMSNDLARTVPIRVDGTTVGLLLSDPGLPPRDFGSPEGDFLARVTQALIYGALGATLLALLLGLLLAQTLTRPLRELTSATESLARGSLGQQVTVRSHDELGTLATSFNRMSADLAHASMLRRQMTADIAHDLRTPLSVIVGYTEALREGKLLPDQEIFDTMYIEAQHLQHLIDDLRTLSLADAGELRLVRQEVAPEALIERVAATYSAPAAAQGVQIVVEAAPDLPTLAVDVERMAQVFGNLLSNALRYTPAGGSVRLRAEAHNDVVQFHVQDTGTGIAADALPHIFERFYRADAARQQDGASGLGLAIVKSIVEAHGGSVSVVSAPGQGTTFTLSLPVQHTTALDCAIQTRS